MFGTIAAMYVNCSQACRVASSCAAPFSCRVTFPQTSETPEIIDIAYTNKECCTVSIASLQVVSAEVSTSGNDHLLAAAFREVLKLGISHWKFPANISNKPY